MKKGLLILLAAFFTLSLANAQSNKEEVDLMQAAFGMQKKAMIAEFVKVEGAQKDAFWKLYDEYETSRKELGKQRIDLFNSYVDNWDKLSNEFAEKWTADLFSLGKKTDDLLLNYYNKVKKATSPIAALQFYQVEYYILTGIRTFLLEELPLPDLKVPTPAKK
jgi:hypothetical protein